MNPNRPGFRQVAVKSIVTHTVAYFIMGLLALTILDYTHFLADSSLNLMMRPTDDVWVMELKREIIYLGHALYLLKKTRKSGP